MADLGAFLRPPAAMSAVRDHPISAWGVPIGCGGGRPPPSDQLFRRCGRIARGI